MTGSGPAQLSHAAALPRDVAAARAALEALLAQGWEGDLDLALIAVHEALINADRHGAGIRDAAARLDEGRLVVEVADYGSGFDHRAYVSQPPDPLAERGRGLWVIHQIASGFSAWSEGLGTRVRLEFDPGREGVPSTETTQDRPPLPSLDLVTSGLLRATRAAVAVVDQQLVIRDCWGDVEELLLLPPERLVDRDARGVTAELKRHFTDPAHYEQRILDTYAQRSRPSEDIFVRYDGRILRRQGVPFSDEAGNRWQLIAYLPVAEQTQVVAAIQQSLLPPVPAWDDLEVSAIYHPAEASAFVGGDFYDFLEISAGNRCVVVGDVSGRGPAAAATSTHVRAYLRAALRSHGVTAAVPDLEATLSKEFRPEDFVTLGMCVQESADVWTMTNCGHVPALLLRGGEVTEFGAKGSALGLGLPAEWPREPFVLRPGDTVLLYTDGVVDAGRRDRRFGAERLVEALRELGDLPVPQLVAGIDERVHSFAGGHLGDDHVLVGMRRR